MLEAHRSSSDTADDKTVTVAIVEDEPVLLSELAFQLERHGFAVATFQTAAEFYRHLAVRPVRIAVLDIGLDGEDGLSICRHLRAHDPHIGIVFTTARSLRDERLLGLEAGADAYLVKPVDPDELVLILHRLAQRTVAAPAVSEPLLSGGWRLDSDFGLLSTPNGHRLRLSFNEVRILRALLRNAGRVCSYVAVAEALGVIWEDYDKHRLEVILSRLRARVERDTGDRLPVVAVRGFGYRFDT